MKIQYQIMELDENHLKKVENSDFTTSRRVCFIPARFKKSAFTSDIQDFLEEALKVIEEYGDEFKEYTVIPRIYKTPY